MDQSLIRFIEWKSAGLWSSGPGTEDSKQTHDCMSNLLHLTGAKAVCTDSQMYPKIFNTVLYAKQQQQQKQSLTDLQ